MAPNYKYNKINSFHNKRLLFIFHKADAIYSLDGVIFSIFPVFGEGAMYLEINELDLVANAALTLSEEGYIQVIFLGKSQLYLSLKKPYLT